MNAVDELRRQVTAHLDPNGEQAQQIDDLVDTHGTLDIDIDGVVAEILEDYGVVNIDDIKFWVIALGHSRNPLGLGFTLNTPEGRERRRKQAQENCGGTRMSGAQLRVIRETLGLTTRWLAEFLGVAERSVHRWESGQSPVPTGVRGDVISLQRVTDISIDIEVEKILASGRRVMLTYRTDADHAAAEETGDLRPASWHRALTAAVARRVPGLVIEYWEPTS